MKTRILITGAMVVAICAFSFTAKAQEEPAIKVVPAMEKNTIKVIYGYFTGESIHITFSDANGFISSDRIRGEEFERGFIKKYKLQRSHASPVWIEVSNSKLAATFKLTEVKSGKWLAALEKTIYTNRMVASK